jgi:ATP-dependent DNA helicase RecG
MQILTRSVVDLRGVGEQVAVRLAKLQIKTLQDVLFHLPYKYVDRTRIHPINTVRIDDTVVIEGTIEKVSIIPKPKRNMLVKLRDATGTAEIRFFYFNTTQQQQLMVGKQMRCFGQARISRNGLQLIHPEYNVFAAGQILPVEEYLTPIYPTTEGVGQKLLRALVQQVLQQLKPIHDTIDILPTEIRQQLNFGPLMSALHDVHFPTPECYTKMLNDGFHPAQRRLAFEELLAHHLSLRQKRSLQHRELAYSIQHDHKLAQKLIAALPFQLTNAQMKNVQIIKQDLAHNYPMLRLVQGDVGSGKTLVAILGALAAIEAGLQVAFMVPTEILAEQHYANILRWFADLNIPVACLTAKLSSKQKADLKQKIANNTYKLIVGTHALFQQDVQFDQLGLVIIDEQHKFGVAQRLALQKKGMQQFVPHQLILTATPIPRTLAMTFYADLDYSVIDELPPGRKPITTVLISDKKRDEVLHRIQNICAQGQQVYWVCTLIAESEQIDSTPAEKLWQDLTLKLPDLKIALIHAKMQTADKELIMQQFKQGEINLLVATTVIEVGVDVPNASLMVIENPERLGLAQLHQLRGRVGRGNNQSYCVLLYKSPLGNRAMQRLHFMRESQDGFAIAEFDLKLRGPGEVFGTKQSGLANLRIADLIRDKDLLASVNQIAELILDKYPAVTSQLLQRWIREQLEYAVV